MKTHNDNEEIRKIVMLDTAEQRELNRGCFAF